MELPFAIQLTERVIPASFNLQPGDSRNFSWSARVIAPIDAGTVRLRTSSANGGSDEIILPVRIPGTTIAEKETVPNKK